MVIISHFENLACEVLQICAETDEEKVSSLLLKQAPEYGNTTSLQIAISANDKNFISHDSCQRLIIKLWLNRIIPETSRIKVKLKIFILC